MSAISDAVDAIYDAVVAINGAPSYTYDLTGSNAVAIGVVESPPGDVHVSILPYVTGPANAGNTLDAVTVVWELLLVGRVATSTDTEFARLDAACDLYDDVLNALKVDRSLGGLVRDVLPGTPEIGATVQGSLPAYGWFLLPLEIEIKRGYQG